jgi:rod shape-determining protein MreC
MVVYRRDTRARTTLLVMIVLCLVLITVDANGNSVVGSVRSAAHNVIAPVQNVVNSAFQPLRDVAGGITHYGSVKSENARLQREIADLRGQLRVDKGGGGEVTQLEKLLDLPTVEDATGIVAEVTGGAPGNFERTVTLNKGSSQGVKVNYPVVTGDGLVGTVTQVFGSSSTVTLLDSPTLGVGVRLEVSGSTAITQARAGGRDLSLTFISDPNTKATKGELVFTTAVTNASFPPGLPVGTVASYSKGPQDLQPTITVAPVVNLDNLDYVKVLRYPDPTAAPNGG